MRATGQGCHLRFALGATPHPPASFAHHQYNPDDKAEILEKVEKSVGVKELNTLVIAESNAAVTENHMAAQDAFASLDIRNANSVGEGGGSGMPPSLRIGRHPSPVSLTHLGCDHGN